MFDSLKARDAAPTECGAQIFRFGRPDNNTQASRNSALASPCASCKVRGKAVCAGLNDEEMEDFSRNIHTRLVKAGKAVYRESEAADNFYTVVTGEVRLANLLGDGRRQLTAFKSAGDLLGENKKGFYQSDAEAVCDTIVCQIPLSLLEKYSNDVPAMYASLATKAQEELCELRHHAVLLGRKTPLEKIATFLCGRMDKLDGKQEDQVAIDLTMGRGDVADFLGLTIETVSRTITKLKNMGLLLVPNPHHFVIRNPARLRRIAEGEE
tara:strand:+ start:2958 stop:3758 length:801 start_codon:yes stop_codon:yes gene_type:complete